MAGLVSVLIDGIVYSSYLFIIAVGLTLIYGVMKILNMAHGSLYALGAYVAATLVGAWFNGGSIPTAASRYWRSPPSWSVSWPAR